MARRRTLLASLALLALLSSSALIPVANAAHSGAKVTLTHTETGISVVKTSTGDGNYEFTAVKPGQYVVTAEKDGFSIALVEVARAAEAAGFAAVSETSLGGL